ncbi:MAG: hypothetical protein ACERK1_13345, partial [Anaerolineales bacterium]
QGRHLIGHFSGFYTILKTCETKYPTHALLQRHSDVAMALMPLLRMHNKTFMNMSSTLKTTTLTASLIEFHWD